MNGRSWRLYPYQGLWHRRHLISSMCHSCEGVRSLRRAQPNLWKWLHDSVCWRGLSRKLCTRERKYLFRHEKLTRSTGLRYSPRVSCKIRNSKTLSMHGYSMISGQRGEDQKSGESRRVGETEKSL